MGIIHKPQISNGLTLNPNFITFRALNKPTIAAMIATLTLLYLSNYISASSGGIMGGSDWDPPSDSSDDSSSYIHSSSYDCSLCGPSSSSLYCSSCDYNGHNNNSEQSESSVFGFWGFTFVAGIMMIFVVFINKDARKTSVIKVQIALIGNIRPLQNDLNRIARTADTSTRGGMRSVLTGTLESLRAHHNSCTSVYSSSKVLPSIDEGKKMFNELSKNEQGKFDEETLVNVNNIRSERTESTTISKSSDTYLVVTILVAAQGRIELSCINTCEELIKAMENLLSIPESKTMAVRVLWTPQQELDTLSSEQLTEDYPLLRPLRPT